MIGGKFFGFSIPDSADTDVYTRSFTGSVQMVGYTEIGPKRASGKREEMFWSCGRLNQPTMQNSECECRREGKSGIGGSDGTRTRDLLRDRQAF